MGLLESLSIGANALVTHQAALQITGNNIANAATPGYTRQEAILQPTGASNFAGGLQSGGGVQLGMVRRVVDESLQQRLNDAGSQMNRYQVADEVLTRVESLMNELTDTDLSSALVQLFNRFDDLSANAQDPALRGTVLNQASAVCGEMRRVRDGLETVRLELTDKLDAGVAEADRLSREIADLNVKIVTAESGGAVAPSLRDQRDQLISRLSELVAVTVRETPNGAVNVFIGSEPLISQGSSRGLAMVTREVDGEARKLVAFADNGTPIELRGGQLVGLQTTRDGEVAQIIGRTDELASQLIWQINRVHSSGTGLAGASEMTGTYQVLDADAALDSQAAGLAFRPVNGSFLISVVSTAPDGTKSASTAQIDVPLTGAAGDLTLTGLIEALNGVAGVSAGVDAGGKLTVRTTDSKTELRFAEDSSGLLAALGINTFFTGSNANNIAVAPAVAANSDRIAAGRTGQPGDGSNAAAMAQAGKAPVAALSGGSLLEYQQRMTADVAVWAAGARDTATSNGVVHEALSAQREAVSGVSLDEEAVNLMRYQRAFQGAARFITIVDEMLDTILKLV